MSIIFILVLLLLYVIPLGLDIYLMKLLAKREMYKSQDALYIYVLIMLVPFVNIILLVYSLFGLMFFSNSYYYHNDPNDTVKKIFNVKEDKKDEKNFKGKGYSRSHH